MLKFHSNTQEDLEIELSSRSTEVSIEIVKSICEALEENADQVFVGMLINLGLGLIINKQNYLNSLKLNFPTVEKAEEYELCSRALNWINRLESDDI